jgi:ribosomal subunit interface protein
MAHFYVLRAGTPALGSLAEGYIMTLKWSLFTRNMSPHLQLRHKLQQKIRKLEKVLTHFPQDAVYLQVNLNKNAKRDWFTAGLTLYLPSNALRSEKSAEDPVPAVDQAIKTLLRELGVLKSSLRHESEWTRVARRTPDVSGRVQAFAPPTAA